jgi:hypothetical protein
MHVRKLLARLGALTIMATALIAFTPSAASAEICPVAPQKTGVAPLACPSAGVAYAQLQDLGGGVVSVYGQTNGWAVGTIRVNATLYYDGVAQWSDQITCYNATACSTTHILSSTCWAGHWMLRVWGNRNGGSKVYDEDWTYIVV